MRAVTASPTRRRRRTAFGGLLAMALMMVAVAATAVGALTLRDSQEGETVGVDVRPVVAFPATPNLALAVADDEGRLASVAVATLLPDGRGGSIVTVPVTADATIGLGPTRQPINTVFSADDPEGLGAALESLLSLTIERVEVLDPERLTEVVAPLGLVDVDLPEDVVDSGAGGPVAVVPAGTQTLRTSQVVDALTAIDDSVVAYDDHPTKVELWSGLAGNAPLGSPTSGDDDDAQDAVPLTADEFLSRLWSGPVQVRDLDIDPGAVAFAENTLGVDVVILDRRDSLLVFTQVSPALVSTPNEGLTFRVEVGYSDEQLSGAGDGLSSRSQVSRTLVGELLFVQANVVSVDETALPGGAPERTRVEVADARYLQEMTEFAALAFGDADVVLAPTLVDGVDVVVTIGTSYLDLKQQRSGDTVESE